MRIEGVRERLRFLRSPGVALYVVLTALLLAIAMVAMYGPWRRRLYTLIPAECQQRYRAARSSADSAIVDATAIISRSPHTMTCGEYRRQSVR